MWYRCSSRLAQLLNIFHKKNGPESGGILFKECRTNKQFVAANPWIKKFAREFGIRSIDPIHIFASINESKLKPELRLRRLNCYLQILGGKPVLQVIDFTGCPTPFTIKIMAVRKLEVQQEIWEVFGLISKRRLFIRYPSLLQVIRNWYGVDLNSFTIFLFWVDSLRFLPLDKNTLMFLKSCKVIETRPKTFLEYRKLLSKVPSGLYREIVQVAFHFNRTYEVGDISPELNRFLNPQTSNPQLSDFRLVAIRVNKGTKTKFAKVLKENVLYRFHTGYEFILDDLIKYNAADDVKMYNIFDDESHLNINIQAIVGKNGTGKSSINELLYLAINNFTKSQFEDSCELEFVKGVNLDLYFQTDTLYKLALQGTSVRLTKFEMVDTNYVKPTNVPLVGRIMEDFFYTIVVNYSHYGLNSLDVGSWINHLFHKNDAYQVPIVINPKRTKGNFDINVENTLVKARLLANILEPIQGHLEERTLRQITENGRSIQLLKFDLNKSKLEYVYDKVPFPNDLHVQKLLAFVYTYFDIKPPVKRTVIQRHAEMYLYKKLVNISLTYPRYFGYFISSENSFDHTRFVDYLELLSADDSHITNKLHQTINFLKYRHLNVVVLRKKISVEKLSNIIQRIIERNYSSRRLRTIELIPPPFFDVEFYLDDGSNFSHLSSGEKQRIYTVNSLIYHLININSVLDEGNLIKYSNINILFDEVELYFHPEMQRTFIAYLLDYLKSVRLNNITGLNFCFVTHSPIVLSDIPKQNILFLNIGRTGKSEQYFPVDHTFAGNVHDMLKDNFYLNNGFMGEFAKTKIQSAIRYLQAFALNGSFSSQEWSKDKVHRFIGNIGEPLIRSSLQNLFFEAFVKTSSEIDAQIEELNEKRKNP
jgi:predicted ATP-binding protein involved in virulence